MSANDKPYLIGLTGGIASGKSEASRTLDSLGAVVIDTDLISRELTMPNGALLGDIRDAFGDEVFFEDGTLNRKALGGIVFSDIASRRKLEGIIHPAVQREVYERLEQCRRDGIQVCVLVVPLMFETGMDAMCDEIWVMSADAAVRESRIVARDKLSFAEARQRISSQMPDPQREARGDLVIKTDRPIEQTAKELKKQYESLLKRLR